MNKNTLYNKHLISINEISKDELNLIVEASLNLKYKPKNNLLKNKLIASCFFEPSTRTRLSFNVAIKKLGGDIIGFSDATNTSIKKGETLSDTIKIISSYADAIILRHPKEGASKIASKFSSVPIINAGDGSNQHPSQTLIDLVSIYETQKTLKNLKIALVGDLKYGRTIHSLAQALKFYNCEFYFVSPKNLVMPKYICEELDSENIKYHFASSIEEIISMVDILYITRIQKERFDEHEFLNIKDHFHLKKNMLNKAKNNLKIMHPLPRVDEIDTSIDETPFAYYFEQAKNGIYVRQAILSLILNNSIWW